MSSEQKHPSDKISDCDEDCDYTDFHCFIKNNQIHCQFWGKNGEPMDQVKQSEYMNSI